jgi:hypothetical protein
VSSDPSFGYDSKLVGYTLPRMNNETHRQIQCLIDEQNLPFIAKQVVPILLAVSKAMPSADGSDGEAWMELCLMALEEMSADVVKEAIKVAVKQSKWRPAPSELLEHCHWIARKRRALLKLEFVEAA